MARTAIPLITASDVGAVSPFGAANVDGGIMPPNAVLVISNGSGGSVTITVETPAGAGVPSGLNLSDRTIAVPAGQSGAIGPFHPTFYARPSAPDAGQVYVNYSAVTSVSVLAVQIPTRWPTP